MTHSLGPLMGRPWGWLLAASLVLTLLAGCTSDLSGCNLALLKDDPIADDRTERFLGKVDAESAKCRGSEQGAERWLDTPWVDWANYNATGDAATLVDQREAHTAIGEHGYPNGRGIDGALIDLERQRIELIKFNLFDNATWPSYLRGEGDWDGAALKVWPEMRLPPEHPDYRAVGGDDDQQLCHGELIRHRTLSGICNDLRNPAMGSTGMLFGRNVQFEASFPELAANDLVRNRHGGRIGLMQPDPQLISRTLFTRDSAADHQCNDGNGAANNSPQAHCSYQPASFFNVLAASWIQFMTHDWFSHLREGRNAPGLVGTGCGPEAAASGCRQGDRMEASLYAEREPAPVFTHGDRPHLARAHRTTRNLVTAWWDASQLYGYDSASATRVLRDPADPARLAQPDGYLPTFDSCAPDCQHLRHWQGQEVAAFADNWNIGLSLLHNLFVREHNQVVDHFRQAQRNTPRADSGLRNPANPDQVIRWQDASDEELFQAARLVVAAEIAKIHTIEWTTQLLYDEPLFNAMNANWFGLFGTIERDKGNATVLGKLLERKLDKITPWFGASPNPKKAGGWYSLLASGAGIVGTGAQRPFLFWDRWDLTNPDHVNGGVNHFGSPFNFPEEFTSVYRLHPMMPDLLEVRRPDNPAVVQAKVGLGQAVRGDATPRMREQGLATWTLSFGHQRLGLLTLENHPRFLQALAMPHLGSPSGKLDIVALDIIRDRERGVPRFNEFRRQIGLRSLRSFDDFVDQRQGPAVQADQRRMVQKLRDVYGTHSCDARKVISDVQPGPDGGPLTDCLGFPDGSTVDNIEDLDTVVGYLAEYTRPHGFAISETQFHIFIINASRRLFSDRFFTSSFRPEFYSHLGMEWVAHNGPLDECPTRIAQGTCVEPGKDNGHVVQVSPMKRVLLRNVPELAAHLEQVRNAFDPWGRPRGEYYDLSWPVGEPVGEPDDEPVGEPAMTNIAGSR